jgi:hypothetical protein
MMRLAGEDRNLKGNSFFDEDGENEDKVTLAEQEDYIPKRTVGELLNIISEKRKVVDYNLTYYRGTLNTMQKNIKTSGAAIWVNVIAFLVVLLFIRITRYAIGTFSTIGLVMGIVGAVYVIKEEVISIKKFLIHKYDKCQRYAIEHKITPAVKAIDNAEKEIAALMIVDEKLSNLENKLQASDTADLDEVAEEVEKVKVELVKDN